MEYNGWKNYETWAVNLWMTDTAADSARWHEAAQDAYNEAEASDIFTRCEQATLDLAEQIKSHHEEYQPHTGDVYDDLLSAAMSEVDWHEIAEHLCTLRLWPLLARLPELTR